MNWHLSNNDSAAQWPVTLGAKVRKIQGALGNKTPGPDQPEGEPVSGLGQETHLGVQKQILRH